MSPILCCKRHTDRIVTFLLFCVVATVAFALGLASIGDYFDNRRWSALSCEWISDVSDTVNICGEPVYADSSQSHDCIDACHEEYEDPLASIYFIEAPSAEDWNDTCYCLTESQEDLIAAQNDTILVDDLCFDVANDSSSDYVDKFIKHCEPGGRPAGRPYMLHDQHVSLSANTKHIDCDNYAFYGDPAWMSLINNRSVMLSLQNEAQEAYVAWLQQALAEHASVATFAKFSLQLMSIGAPLWLIEMANHAAIDEIRHTQISFDIANAYRKRMNATLDGLCVIADTFPAHTVDVKDDWHAIAVDTALGGCIGETVAALTLGRTENGDLDAYVHGMAMDEVKHAALAWAVVSWMVQEGRDEVLFVMDKMWWEHQLKERMTGEVDCYTVSVYTQLIPKILDELRNVEQDYRSLYKFVIDSLLAFSPACE